VVAIVPPTPQGGGMGEIAYASVVKGAAQIFIVNADGTGLRQLTNIAEGACSFDWSPDGKQLVYTSPCAGKEKDYPGSTLYLLDIESGESRPLPFKKGGDFEPAWSPNGDEIAFTSMRDGTMQVYVYKFRDESLTLLTKPIYSPQAHYPAWSPDSSQLAYTVIRSGLLQIWTMSADGKNQQQQVRMGGTFSDYLPVWSPDGTTLLFSQTNTSLNGISSLQRYGFETKQVDALPLSPSLSATDAHFSPDGSWIVYEGSDGSSQDIYTWHMFEGQPQRLTTSSQIDFDAVWRPGGVGVK
jgi:TolB protein